VCAPPRSIELDLGGRGGARKEGTRALTICHAHPQSADLPLIMGMLWRRMSDTGKDWRHVYKVPPPPLSLHGNE